MLHRLWRKYQHNKNSLVEAPGEQKLRMGYIYYGVRLVSTSDGLVLSRVQHCHAQGGTMYDEVGMHTGS